jgi:hypothetical protein
MIALSGILHPLGLHRDYARGRVLGCGFGRGSSDVCILFQRERDEEVERPRCNSEFEEVLITSVLSLVCHF